MIEQTTLLRSKNSERSREYRRLRINQAPDSSASGSIAKDLARRFATTGMGLLIIINGIGISPS